MTPGDRESVPRDPRLRDFVTLCVLIAWGALWIGQVHGLSADVEAARIGLLQLDLEKAALFGMIQNDWGDEPLLGAVAVQGSPILPIDQRFQGLIWVFTTTCRHSPAALPALLEIAEGDIPILAVALDDDPEAVLTWLAERALPFPVVMDPSGPIADLFSSLGTPYTILLDRGQVRTSVLGPISQLDRRRIRSALSR